MKEEKDILSNLKKTDQPSVPNGFFESFSDQLMSKIETDSLLESLPKTNKPAVPEGYFETFSDKLMEKLPATAAPVKKTKIIPLRIMLAVASVAAVLTFVVLTTKQNEQPILAETETSTEIVIDELADEDYDDYLAYIDESTIVDYIVENDLDIDDETEIDESIYSEIESELDDYYYGL